MKWASTSVYRAGTLSVIAAFFLAAVALVGWQAVSGLDKQEGQC